MDRAIILQLKPTNEQAQILLQSLHARIDYFYAIMQEEFTVCCSNGGLRKRMYYPLRAQCPDLPAQLVCATRVRVTGAVKSALDRRKKGCNGEYPTCLCLDLLAMMPGCPM